MRETTIDHQVENIFRSVMNEMSTKIPPALFDSVFADSVFELKSLSDGKAVFVSDSESSAALIKKAYLIDLERSLKDVTQTNYDVEILDRSSYNRRKEAVQQANGKFFQNSHLSPQYTFASFVVGENNRAAYQASLFAVEKPALSNPLFLYAKSGMGKTHLLQAIGNAYKEKHPDANVLYITTDDFVSEYVKFAKGNAESEGLKDFFGTVDLLLVDDIQFLADKTKTQILFFNVFNLLVSQGKQIVLTSDKSPTELAEMGDEHLQDRLVSRFSGGLSIHLTNPNRKTMVEILKRKTENSGLSLDLFDDAVFDYLAENNSANVRVLEGALTRLLFAMTMEKPQGKVTLAFVKSVFEDEEQRKTKRGKIDVTGIIETVGDYYSLTPQQLTSKVRTSQIALARQMAMYLARKILSLPYQEIGKAFGKDHTTVLANVQKIEKLRGSDSRVEKALEELKKKIEAREGR